MYKHNQITLGSLFDGIGGFPYAGSFFGIKPLWASEIMPQAISVTQRHFPEMEHVGDITKLDGGKLPPVDIITFGSPCQDLSTAGKRAGLAGERSGLFSEAIRIIDEMRRATNGKYPRYAIWENVPGALSSGNPRGSDFRAVLEAFTKTEIPIPKSGVWANAGMVRGGGVDLAWCVYNAQHFGVPQRRRRIFLVCDFGGRSAGEILFIPKSLSGYFEACRAQGQGSAGNAQRGVRGASRSACVKDTAATIFAGYGNAGAHDGANFALSPVPNCLNPWDTQQSRVFAEDGTSPTLAGADGGGGRNPGGLVFAAFMGDSSPSSYGIEYMEEAAPTLKPRLSGTPCVYKPISGNQQALFEGHGNDCRYNGPLEIAPTISASYGMGGGNIPLAVCPPGDDPDVKCAAFLGGASAKARSIGYSEKVSPTLKGEPCGFSAPCVCEANACIVVNDQGGNSLSIEKAELSPTLRSETHGNLPIVSIPAAYPINTQIATRHEALGDNTGFGVGKDGDPAFTLQQAHSHAVAVGVHQNQAGDMHISDKAYSLATNGNATGRNAPLVAHPAVCGTLVASSAGLSRPGGMASETDLCVVVPANETIPIHDRATRYSGGGDTRNNDGSGNGLGIGKDGDPAPTITAGDRHSVAAYCLQGNMIGRQERNGPNGSGVMEGKSFTLTATDVAAVTAVDCRNFRETDETSGTLQAKGSQAGYSLNCQNPVRMGYIVRRLLPVECERLQGYPDGWTEFGHDGTPISDTRRYQMLGNSVAVPCVVYIMMGIAAQFRREVKVAE